MQMVTKNPWIWQPHGGGWALCPPDLPGGLAIGFFGRRSPRVAGASMEQVHGSRVDQATSTGPHAACDGLVTRQPGLPLTIRTADCLPLVVWTPGALGVCHAGWRGLAEGVVENTLMALGGGEARAWIGPAIRVCCFEVGHEVADRFPRSARRGARKPHVDLVAEATNRLLAAGVARVEDSRACTRCRGHMLFSHRGSGGAPGRNLTVATLG